MVSVLIAGAGPVGLTLANELTRYGIGVRIVDPAAERTDKSKALVLWSRTLELFDQGGYVDPFLAAGVPAQGAQLSNGKDVVARVSLDSIQSRYPYALMIPQSETERVLEEQLGKRGVKVERTVSLESFADKSEGVQAVLRSAKGETETVTADWLIGCDGAHSTVRHGLGFAFEGTTQQSDWWLADVMLTGLEPYDLLHIFWHKDGILAFFPMGSGRWRVIGDRGPATSAAHHPDPMLEEVQALITHRGTAGIVISHPYWLAAFRINERKVAHYGRGRVFVAGDAAHIHSPAGGQGMNTGMQDVFNLAWKLSLVIRGVCKPALLDSYSIERSAVGDMVLSNASRLTDMAVLRNPLLQTLRNTVVKFASGFPQVAHIVADTLSELNIGYPKSPSSVTSGHPHETTAGARWPDRLPGDASKAHFTAVGPSDTTAALAAKFPQLVQAGGAKATDLSLIRPDGYVGFAGAASDRSAAEAYLQNLAR